MALGDDDHDDGGVARRKQDNHVDIADAHGDNIHADGADNGNAAAAAAPVASAVLTALLTPPRFDPGEAQVFEGEWDAEGVWVYQAFNDAIADHAVAHQRLGGPAFKPLRMTWVKPSFGWVLYRSGYARKHNQTRVLKLKVPHEAMAELLSKCACKHGGGGAKGRVQWDPARDVISGDGSEPRKMARRRAIQIGFKGELSQRYVDSVVAVVDVTTLAHDVQAAHKAGTREAIAALKPSLAAERPYMPACPRDVLVRLGMLPGETARWVARIGLGEAFPSK